MTTRQSSSWVSDLIITGLAAGIVLAVAFGWLSVLP